MFGIKEDCTFLFSDKDLVNYSVQVKSNVDVYNNKSSQTWDAFDGRFYVSKEDGVNSLMVGIIFHVSF